MIDPYLRGLIKGFIKRNDRYYRDKLEDFFEGWRSEELQKLSEFLRDLSKRR